MAEIGVIASIAGIVAAGTKLSVALFDFGSTIGSAGYEIRRIGSEISLFCAVLKQVQSKLRKSKATRYSLGAIQTTQEVLDECELVFKEIKSIIDSLTKEKLCSGRATIDWKSRIKWTFKRSQIQLQRTTLESCKITLNLMLITLDFDRKVASRRVSTVETEKEDEEERRLAKTLLNAHRCTIDTLEKLEAKQTKDAKIEMVAPSTENQLSSPHIFAVESTNSKTLAETPLPVKRASLWASTLIHGSSPLTTSEKLSKDPNEHESSHQLDYFLRKWTNQDYPPPPKETFQDTPEGQPLLTTLELYIAQLKATVYSASHTFQQLRGHGENISDLTNMEIRALNNRRGKMSHFMVVVNRELLEVKKYNQLVFALATTSRTLRLGCLDAATIRSKNLRTADPSLSKHSQPKIAPSRKIRTKGSASGILLREVVSSTPSKETIMIGLEPQPLPLDRTAKPKKRRIGWQLDQDSLPSFHGRYSYPLVSPNSTSQAILSPLIETFAIGPSFNYVLYVKYANSERRIEPHETPFEVWKKMAVFKVNLLFPSLVVKYEVEAGVAA